MSKGTNKYLRFNDGVSIRTSGKLRTIRRSDGYYVVGNGSCVPVSSYQEAQGLISELSKGEPSNG